MTVIRGVQKLTFDGYPEGSEAIIISHKRQQKHILSFLCLLWLIPEFLAHHQPAHATIHHANPNASKLSSQNVRAVARRIH